jgi:hypothetical protein
VLYTGCLEGGEMIDDFFSFRLRREINSIVMYGREMAVLIIIS